MHRINTLILCVNFLNVLITHMVLKPEPGLRSAAVTAASWPPHRAAVAVQRTTVQPGCRLRVAAVVRGGTQTQTCS